MKYWIVTDTHFGHAKMHEYCGRPEDFESQILKNVGGMPKYGDVLIHLGDFCIGNDRMWHDSFNHACMAKKWLIRGNHDNKSSSWYLGNGWDFVADEITMKMFGKRLILSHRPVIREGEYLNIHGHHHNNLHHPEDSTDERNRLVYMEHEYAPILLRRIVEAKAI